MRETDKVIGIRETVKLLKKGKVDHVVLAGDTDDSLKEMLLDLCEAKSVPVEEATSRAQLGQLNGIERPATIVAYLKA